MAWFGSTKRRKTYGTDHGYTLLAFLTVEIAEMEVEDGELVVDERLSLQRFPSSGVVPLEKAIPRKSCRGAQNECTTMLNEAISSLLKPLKRVAQSGFEVSLRSGET